METMTLPVLLALLLGKLLKEHPGVSNRLIPYLLFTQQFLQEFQKQLAAGNGPDVLAAAQGALPVVAAAVLSHQAGKGALGLVKKLGPILGGLLKLAAFVK